MAVNTDEPQATLFERNDAFPHLTNYFDTHARFVYRVHTPQSSGKTEATFVASTGAGQGHKDILQLDHDRVREKVGRHLTTFSRTKEDNFMSWTQSLLFAIQYAQYRENNDKLRSSVDQIKISILDTQRVPRGSFMPASVLLDTFEIKLKRGIDHKWFCDEYLSQGRLDIPEGAMATTTLDDLIAHGLHDFYPKFGEKLYNRRLYIRVDQLRSPLKHGDPEDPSPENLNLAGTIAEKCCADPGFRPVLFASLLSLKHHNTNDRSIMVAFSKFCAEWGQHSVDLIKPSETTSMAVPEHRQFVEMMLGFQEYQRQRENIRTDATEVSLPVPGTFKVHVTSSSEATITEDKESITHRMREMCICSASITDKIEINKASEHRRTLF